MGCQLLQFTKPCKRTLNKKSELKLGIKLQSPAWNMKYISIIVSLGQSINQARLPQADNLITMQLLALLHDKKVRAPGGHNSS